MEKKSSAIQNAITYVVLSISSIIILYPIFLVVTSSVKIEKDYAKNPIGLPHHFHVANYADALIKAHFGMYFGNSVFITAASVVGILLLGAMAAYAINLRFKGHNAFFVYFLLGLMVPPQATIVATYIFMKQLHLVNTYLGLILEYDSLLLPLSTFMFRGFFNGVPKELSDAALIDGSTETGILWRIIFPLSRPIVATVIILTSLEIWNDFFLPLILLQDKSKFTLPLGLVNLQDEYFTNWPLTFAAVSIMMIPIVGVFLIFQRHFIKGITTGAVKG